ncbi:MAG: GNAT family N-acetyltransferase [Bacteroidota bacterium]|nr:GNAT family N-acetyltransferase [Bacteroidota bacterium]
MTIPLDYFVSTDKTKLDVDVIHQFLSSSYWAKGIPRSVIKKSIEHSLCFGVYHDTRQVGFARVISDFTTFAYLADVFILETYRGKGLSKMLMKEIVAFPQLRGLRRFILATRDAHGLYKQFGFTEIKHPDRWMEIHNPNVYKK